MPMKRKHIGTRVRASDTGVPFGEFVLSSRLRLLNKKLDAYYVVLEE
jgi:hypothetical protein